MILDLISQSVLETIDNSEDSVPNKIREKEESLQNTLNKRFSIPMIALENDKKNYNQVNADEYAKFDSSNANAVYTAEPTRRVDKDASKYFDENECQWQISSIDFRTLLEGDEKPINVKEHMIINMMKKDINDFIQHDDSKIDSPADEQIVNDNEIFKDNNVRLEGKVVEEEKREIGKYGIPSNIEKVLSNTFDFDTTVVAINQTKREYKNISEKADMATQAAIESEELLQKVSNEYSEAEKHLKEKEKRSIEMEQKIISILNTEKNKLNKQMQEKETLINDANKRKEQNDDKIVDYRSKINSTIEKANEIDEKISRQEELLNTLVGFNINLDDYQLDTDKRNNGRIV